MVWVTWIVELAKAFVGSDTGKVILGGAGALLVAFLTQVMTIWKDGVIDKRKRQRMAHYSAALLAGSLYVFISRCLDVLHDDGGIEHGGMMKPTVEHPKLEFPSQIDWTVFDPQFMYEMLLLPMLVDKAAKDTWAKVIEDDRGGPPDFDACFPFREEEFSKLGSTAYERLLHLWKEYQVPIPPETKSAWIAFGKHLDKRRREREEWAAEMEKRKAEGGIVPVAYQMNMGKH